ncbi:MAG: DNA repair protein RecN [Methylococcales bacterium]
MLSSITIFDLAVVQSLELELDRGLTVLTGETGAGKSILLTALGLALGNRADSGYIRPNCKRAEITLEFNLQDSPDAASWLKDHELDENNQCLIRRVITEDGRSRAYINNRQTTLQSLQELSSHLLEIHGQHAHLTLLTNSEQRRLLDDYGGLNKLVNELNIQVKQWQSVHNELEQREHAMQDADARIELLRYQVEELEKNEVETLEYATISDQQHRLTHLDSILTTAQSELTRLYDDEQSAVANALDSSIQALTGIVDFAPELQDVVSMLTESHIQIEEASRSLRQILDSQEPDPEQLSWLNDKLVIFHDLARKHQIQPDQLNTHLLTLKQQLGTLDSSEETLEALRQTKRELETNYQALAKKLSERRGKLAKKLSTVISDSISRLGMPQGQFVIEIQPGINLVPQLYGSDQIQFLISANPGLPPKPMSKIASGGELSRISLAIQVAVSQTHSVATMIFDEVDSGIGGGTAQIVGDLLRQLGKTQQVLCVTHLPQVAAQSHQHLLVHKSTDGDSTQSSVSHIADDERAQEIARMLGGIDITEQTLAHAQEMLDWSDSPAA